VQRGAYYIQGVGKEPVDITFEDCQITNSYGDTV